MQCLPQAVAQKVQKVPCETVFRFGNSSTVVCQYAPLVPLAKWSAKICVVNSQTPFLISNRQCFRTLGAQITTAQDPVLFSEINAHLPLKLSKKKLYLLDFCELLRQSMKAGQQVSESTHTNSLPVMNVQRTSDLKVTNCEPIDREPTGTPKHTVVSNERPLV